MASRASFRRAMSRRADAMSAAIDIITDLRRMAVDPEDRLRFTIGRVNVVPNSPNTIPEQVRFTIDMRHPEQRVLEDRTREIVRALHGHEWRLHGCGPRAADATT